MQILLLGVKIMMPIQQILSFSYEILQVRWCGAIPLGPVPYCLYPLSVSLCVASPDCYHSLPLAETPCPQSGSQHGVGPNPPRKYRQGTDHPIGPRPPILV